MNTPSSLAGAAPSAPVRVLSSADARQLAHSAVTSISSVVRGKPDVILLTMASVLARGHVLLDDVPGVGKTTLARAFAKVLGCSFSRIQFTADMLPSDVIGVQVLDTREGTLRFRRGPIFANLVLADEINRASPKTQSALLEAMADRQVSVDDATHMMPAPFLVLATQNPVEHHGAYPLPESQLDRFTISISVGYPPAEDEKRLLLEHYSADHALSSVAPVLNPELLLAVQQHAAQTTLSEAAAGYLLQIVDSTRRHPEIELGCSPRGSLAYAAIARSWAFLRDRTFVTPDDIKDLARAVLSHRIALRGVAVGAKSAHRIKSIVDEIVASTPVPR